MQSYAKYIKNQQPRQELRSPTFLVLRYEEESYPLFLVFAIPGIVIAELKSARYYLAIANPKGQGCC